VHSISVCNTKVAARKYFLGARFFFLQSAADFLPLFFSLVCGPSCNKDALLNCALFLGRELQPRPKNALETRVKRLLFLFSHSRVRGACRTMEIRLASPSFYGATNLHSALMKGEGLAGYQVMQPA
jgi:hypothetical protein